MRWIFDREATWPPGPYGSSGRRGRFVEVDEHVCTDACDHA